MAPVVKREILTTHNPDGTVTTTRTRTLDRTTEYDYDYDDDVSADLVLDSCGYCCTPGGALRILQILIGFVIVGCVSSVYGPGPFFDNVLGGQTYVLVIACICVCVTFCLLIVFALGFHLSILGGMPWREIDLFYSILAVIFYLVAGGVEVWYAIGLWDTKGCRDATIHNVSHKNCPLYIAWIIAAACCFLNVLLYALGALLSRMGKYYL